MPEVERTRSRRSLLAAAGAATIATAAGALARPMPVAAVGATVTVDDNALTGTGTTGITSSVNGAVLRGTSTYAGGGGDAYGVFGQASGPSGIGVGGRSGGSAGWGVFGYANGTGGWGVYGRSALADGYGVKADADATTGTGAGVSAFARSPNGFGVTAEVVNGGVGVRGASWAGSPDEIPASPRTGVYGYAIADVTSRGVSGQSTIGTGVRGEATTGTGVLAIATTGQALDVTGKARFNRSGKATVLKGKSSVDIVVAGGITARTIITASLQARRGTAAVASIRPNYPVAGRARIYLTKVASTTGVTPVGWIATEY